MNVRDISIYEIGLSVRSANALRRAGVNTVGELLGQTWESLSVDTAIVRNPICGHAIQNFQFIFLILVDRSLTSPTVRQ